MQSGGRVIARTTNGERTTGNMMTCRKVAGEKVTVEKEGGTRGQEMRRSRCDRREVNNKDDDRKKKTGKKGTTEKAAGGKASNQGAKRRSYSEAVIDGALRTERIFMGDSIL
ncbi:hypothetical protein NP493_626g02018 [Ridgeia piscesae]|uniref:Uncharacterized protein n=1 Tax=Ridgeia piscesae TaxID=27915 RepID=A0AAD9KU86_RIDPI|nr:hypothetical protein NP493_626g02018 [Ridgeia piscesae]